MPWHFECSMSEVPYIYYMTVSPLDGKLYISDHQSLRIIRVKTMGAVRDLAQNFEVIAGTGDQCIPGDPEQCGDSGLATNAHLLYPKGKDWTLSLSLTQPRVWVRVRPLWGFVQNRQDFLGGVWVVSSIIEENA